MSESLEKIVSELVEKRYKETILEALDGEMTDVYAHQNSFKNLLSLKIQEIMKEEINKRSEDIRQRVVDSINKEWGELSFRFYAEVSRSNRY